MAVIDGKTPWERYEADGDDALRGMVFGALLRVSRKATKTDMEIARRGNRDFDKSTDDQAGLARAWALPLGVKLKLYYEIGVSGKDAAREVLTQMLRDAEDGELDGLWFFDLDRAARMMRRTTALADLSEVDGVLICEMGKIFNPDDDRLLMLIKGAISEAQLRKIKKHTKRGRESNLAKGYPYGPVSYGWARAYHDGTQGQQLIRSLDIQYPDGLLGNDIHLLKPGGDGLCPGCDLPHEHSPREPGQAPRLDQLRENSPAWVVVMMFTWYASGWYDEKIAAELNARDIPVSLQPGPRNPRRVSDAPKWRASRVRRILTNPQYAGYQTRKGKIVPGVFGRWVPLVPAELYHSCQALRAGKRGKYRDADARTDARYATGGGPYTLSATVRCGKCGGTMDQHPVYLDDPDATSEQRREWNAAHSHYECGTSGCWGVSIRQVPLDDHADDTMVGWLCGPAVIADLAVARDAQAESDAADALAEIGQCQGELEGLDARQESGELTARARSIEERKLEKAIEAARKRAELAGCPALVRPLLGDPDLPDDERQIAVYRLWMGLTALEKRAIIRTVAVIHIRPSGRGGSNQYVSQDAGSRVHWHWVVGPCEGDGPYVLPEKAPPRNSKLLTVTIDGQVVRSGEYTTAEKGELCAELMGEHGWSAAECGRHMGVDGSTVRYWRRAAGLAVPERARVTAAPEPSSSGQPEIPPASWKRVTVTVGGQVTHSGEYDTAGKGELAARLMAEHGWTQAQAGAAFGVDDSTVSRWLRVARQARGGA